MILSGIEIHAALKTGDVEIEPFIASHVNPNSYNFRLFPKLLIKESCSDFVEDKIPKQGYLLRPKTLYLGATYEIIGSRKYAMTLLGRSSVGRLGMYLNKTADFGHVGYLGRWTLEISVIQPLVVYPKMKIGQVAFWVSGQVDNRYSGRYYKDYFPTENKDGRIESGAIGKDTCP